MSETNHATVYGPNTAGTKSKIGTHAEANDLKVEDGHLFVKNGENTIAVYAPKIWQNANLDAS